MAVLISVVQAGDGDGRDQEGLLEHRIARGHVHRADDQRDDGSHAPEATPGGTPHHQVDSRLHHLDMCRQDARGTATSVASSEAHEQVFRLVKIWSM